MLPRLASFLFDPSPHITNDSERRSARITSIMCFVVFIQRVLDNIGLLALGTRGLRMWTILALTPCIFAMYILSRTKYARFATDGVVWFFIVFFIATFLVSESRTPTTFLWLLIPLTISSLLHSVQRTLVIWAFTVGSTILLSRLYVTDPFTELVLPIGLIIVVGLLLLIASAARHRDRAIIETQNQQLAEQKLALEDTNRILENTVVGQSVRLHERSAELTLEKQSHYKTERALQKKQRLEGIGLLAGGIAHDFNNLLTGLGNQIAIAAHKVDEDSPAHKHLQKAAAQVSQTSTITRQLLAYVSDNHNTATELDLRGLVLDIYSFIGRAIDRNVTLTHDICLDSDQIMCIWGESAQFQQVVLNLIVNAADAITENNLDSGGTVSISLDSHQLTSVDILQANMLNNHEMTPGKYFELTVKDTGCGMDAATINKIFDPFFTTKQTGHGLGLSAVLGILHRHGAGLIVDSQVGIGTSFHVFFPEYVSTASDETLEPELSPQANRGSHLVPLHILLIDDDIPVQEATAELLEIQGHSVEIASNGYFGIKAVDATLKPFDLILLDLNMPIMGGVPTFHALREKNPTLPIVIHSGNDPYEIDSLLSGGSPTAFLAKPYTSEQMLNAIDDAMRERIVPQVQL